jgi:aspartate aminotransferase
MGVRISARARAIQPSLTLAVSQRAAKLRAEGVDVIGFGAGEPDFATPEHIQRAAAAAVAAGATRYTAVPGIPALRAAVAGELARIHETPLTPENVIVSAGAKQSLFNLLMALLDPGDEVIIPSPCWVSYPELVSMAAGTPVILETRLEEGYRVDEAALRALITPKTRAVILCSPCNPTGAMYDAATLEGIARAVADRAGPETYVITDDIYRRLVYTGEWVSFARVAGKRFAGRVIFVDGVSKTYAMTGWRIGYCAAPRELVSAMSALQSQSTTNAAAVSQAAAVAALTGPQEPAEEMRREFDRRRRVMVDRLRAIPGVKLHEPAGAFYAFPNLSTYLRGKIADDLVLAEYLLDRAHVAVVPGSGFLAPGFARLSYACSMAEVEEGTARIAKALKELP